MKSAVAGFVVLCIAGLCGCESQNSRARGILDPNATRPSLTYGEAGTYPILENGEPNTSVMSSITEAYTTLGLDMESATLQAVMTTEGWFNKASLLGSFRVARGNTTLMTKEHTGQGTPAWIGWFSVRYSEGPFFPWTPACGATATGTTQHRTWWAAQVPPLPTVEWGDDFASSVAPPASSPTCAPPKPKMTIAYQGSSGSSLSIALVPGLEATVGLDASQSTVTDGGTPTYSWSAAGSGFGNGASSWYTTSTNTTFGLSVQQEDGQSASTSGTLTITPVVCEGITPIYGGCEDEEGNPVSVGGSGQSITPMTVTITYVCDIMYWYVWTGTGWVFDGYDVLACWNEYS
jgi:hypothetical protein